MENLMGGPIDEFSPGGRYTEDRSIGSSWAIKIKGFFKNLVGRLP